MRWIVTTAALVAALSLVACDRSGETAKTSAPAADNAAEPAKAAEPVQAADGGGKAAEPAKAANDGAAGTSPVEGKPYRRPGDPAKGVDEFVFWGWSEDGRYYAFETFHNGSDMVNCEGEAELTIVDAQTDRYADDGHIVVVHKEPEAETCDPPDLRVELGHRRDPRLARYGISATYIGGPIELQQGKKTSRWNFTPPDGGPIGVSFRVLHENMDPMFAADGAAFELKIKQEGMSEVVVEPGRRRRPWTLTYNLDDGMVFVGPKGRYTAIMVAQRMTMPEGIRTTWMSSGVTLK